jgi:hypothetical protein
MIIKLQGKEINVSKEEAEQVEEALLAGAEFVKIEDELINSKYIIGIFKSQEPEPQTNRPVLAPPSEKRDLIKIKEVLEKLRKELEEMGIIKKQKTTP